MWYIGGDGDGYCLTIILYMRLNFVRVFSLNTMNNYMIRYAWKFPVGFA